MSQLLERAPKITGSVQEDSEQIFRRQEAAKQARYDRKAESLGEKVAQFVDRESPRVINEVTEGIENDRYTVKSWRVDRGLQDPLPLEELAHHEALRDVVAEHFRELGLSVHCYELRDGEKGHEIMGVEVNSDRYVPAKPTNHVLVMAVYRDVAA